MIENEAVDADNFRAKSGLSFDDTLQMWCATVRRLSGAETHLRIPGAIFTGARSAAQGTAATWAAWLSSHIAAIYAVNSNEAQSAASLLAWHTAIRQDIIRQIVAFTPLPPLD
jgi:hypothetical protein